MTLNAPVSYIILSHRLSYSSDRNRYGSWCVLDVLVLYFSVTRDFNADYCMIKAWDSMPRQSFLRLPALIRNVCDSLHLHTCRINQI